MTAFASKIVTTSDSYAANRQEMLSLIDDLHTLKDRAKALSERRDPFSSNADN